MDGNRDVLIENLLDIPKDCIVNQVIPKKMIFEEATLKSSDKKIFTDLVRQLKWYAKFAESTIRIPKYEDEERDYEEVQIINIILKDENITKTKSTDNSFFKQDKKINRIIDIVFRFIPFPLLIVVQYKKELRLFVSHISNHLSDFSKITLDEIISTDWMDTQNLGNLQNELFKNLQLKNLDFENLYKFYSSIVNNIIQYEGSIKVGHVLSLNVDETKEINDKISRLDIEITNLMRELKIETQPCLIADINDEIRIRLIEKDNLINKLNEG